MISVECPTVNVKLKPHEALKMKSFINCIEIDPAKIISTKISGADRLQVISQSLSYPKFNRPKINKALINYFKALAYNLTVFGSQMEAPSF